MPLYIPIEQWLSEDFHSRLLATRNQILTDRDLSDGFGKGGFEDALGFIFKSIFSCKPDTANRVLEKLFRIRSFTGDPDLQFSLELFWASSGGRPPNTPWSKWSASRLVDASIQHRVNPKHVSFFEKWTYKDVHSRLVEIPIKKDYDVHQWKASQDLWTHAICARMLCTSVGGPVEMPGRENVEEAFEALDKLFTVLQSRGANIPREDPLPMKVYFMLAVYLGHQEKAREILKMAIKDWFWVRKLLDVPALYEVLAAADDPPDNPDDVEMKEAEEVIDSALASRAEHGVKLPLDDVPIAELLRRFSEAAFFVYNEAYLEKGIDEPQKVLRPPLTEEEIVGIQEKLGEPLPPDLKEMVLIADGFYGGWHFAGGGWGGLENSYKGSDEMYDLCLGFEPEPERKMVTMTREDGSTYEVTTTVRTVQISGRSNSWGDVWVCNGAAECDDFEHIICPPTTWKNMQEAMGKRVEKEGEYVYVYFAHWTGGGEEIYPSVRALIAEETLELEDQVAAGWREVREE